MTDKFAPPSGKEDEMMLTCECEECGYTSSSPRARGQVLRRLGLTGVSAPPRVRRAESPNSRSTRRRVPKLGSRTSRPRHFFLLWRRA